MKRIIFILIGIMLSGIISAQKTSMFRKVPTDLFTRSITTDRTIQGQWLWRFSTIITATELTWVKETKSFVSAPLSSVGPAIGYKHFTALEDGVPYCDWGVSGALLLGTDIENVTNASLKIAVLANAFQYLNFGVVYTIQGTNHFGLLLGGSVNF